MTLSASLIQSRNLNNLRSVVNIDYLNVVYGQKTMSTVVEKILPSGTVTRLVKLHAKNTNSGPIYIGFSSNVSSNTGDFFYGGDADQYDIDNSRNAIYGKATATGYVLAYQYFL